MMDKIQRRQEELQQIRDLKAKLWKRIARTVNAYDKLNERERRLLKPRKLEPHEKESSQAITSKDWHQIRDDFDDGEVLATL